MTTIMSTAMMIMIKRESQKLSSGAGGLRAKGNISKQPPRKKHAFKRLLQRIAVKSILSPTLPRALKASLKHTFCFGYNQDPKQNVGNERSCMRHRKITIVYTDLSYKENERENEGINKWLMHFEVKMKVCQIASIDIFWPGCILL